VGIFAGKQQLGRAGDMFKGVLRGAGLFFVAAKSCRAERVGSGSSVVVWVVHGVGFVRRAQWAAKRPVRFSSHTSMKSGVCTVGRRNGRRS